MNKLEYLKIAHANKRTGNRSWLLRVLTPPLVTPPLIIDRLVLGDMYYNDKLQAIGVTEDGEVPITGLKPKIPIYGVKEKLTINKDDFLMVKGKHDTYYSNLLLNLILLEIPFGDKIPYHNVTFTPQMLDKITATGLKDKSITVEEYLTFTKAIGLITAFTSVTVPSATRRGITPPKDIYKRRDALLAKHKDELDNPVIIAKIEEELVDYYKEYIKGDPSEGYFLAGKDYAVSLKKQEIMFGGEPRLDDKSKIDVSTLSLREGWDMEKLPEMTNSLRMGIYARGKDTALGGEAAKFSARVYQNTILTDKDCGTLVGTPFHITKYNKDMFLGRFIVTGKTVKEIKKGDLNSKQGTVVLIRSPLTCQTPNGNFCPICMGKEVSEASSGIGVMASSVSNVFMGISMSLMHGRSLSTAKYDYKESLV